MARADEPRTHLSAKTDLSCDLLAGERARMAASRKAIETLCLLANEAHKRLALSQKLTLDLNRGVRQPGQAEHFVARLVVEVQGSRPIGDTIQRGAAGSTDDGADETAVVPDHTTERRMGVPDGCQNIAEKQPELALLHPPILGDLHAASVNKIVRGDTGDHLIESGRSEGEEP